MRPVDKKSGQQNPVGKPEAAILLPNHRSTPGLNAVVCEPHFTNMIGLAAVGWELPTELSPALAATLTQPGLSLSVLRIFFLIRLFMLTVLMVNKGRHFHIGVFRTLIPLIRILDVDSVIRGTMRL